VTRRVRRLLRVFPLTVALAAALAGCQVPGYGAPHGATTQGQDTYHLWQAEVTTALVVGVIVWALIFFVIVRFRRRRRDQDQLPSQRQYVLWVEVLYTLIPVAIVAVLFGVTVATQQRIDRVSAHPDVRIDVTGFQWGWRFNYVDDGVTVVSQGTAPPEMVLPVHQTVGITLVSTDVVHAFYVPGFLFQRNAQPGITNHFDINVTKPGAWGGSCTTFCGLRHAQMLFSVRAVSSNDFRAWIASQPHTPPS
jgi:cytochrome c oxidase subunit II